MDERSKELWLARVKSSMQGLLRAVESLPEDVVEKHFSAADLKEAKTLSGYTSIQMFEVNVVVGVTHPFYVQAAGPDVARVLAQTIVARDIEWPDGWKLHTIVDPATWEVKPR